MLLTITMTAGDSREVLTRSSPEGHADQGYDQAPDAALLDVMGMSAGAHIAAALPAAGAAAAGVEAAPTISPTDPEDGSIEATDLGFLLHKNPARAQSFKVSTGVAHVFYPEARATRCTVALLLEVDPVGFVRGRQGPSGEGF